MIFLLVIRPIIFLLLLFAKTCSCKTTDHDHQNLYKMPFYSHSQMRDLDIVSEEQNNSFLRQIGNTQTSVGSKRRVDHFTHIPCDNAFVQQRALLLSRFIHDEDKVLRLKQLLKEFHEYESYFQKSAVDLDPIAERAVESFYYKAPFLRSCNGSALALDALSVVKYCGLFGPLFEHLLLHFALDHVSTWLGKSSGHTCTHDSHGHHDHVCVNHLEAPAGSSSALRYGLQAIKGIHLAIHIGGMKEMWDQIVFERNVLEQIAYRTNMTHKALCLARMLVEEIGGMGYHSALFGLPEDEYEKITEMLQDNKKMKKFLRDRSYKKSASGTFGRSGKLLVHYALIRDYSSVLENVLHVIGDIDALTSIASWYIDCKKSDKPVCMVEFVDDINPVFRADNLWDTAINKKEVIGNSIRLDREHATTMVITGPNKSGKSCLLKSIGRAVVLAQTYGVAPAQDLLMTPFGYLLTHIIVTDDTNRDRSLMVSEMMRAEDSIEIAQHSNGKVPILLLVDDSLFKGTTYQKGQELAADYARALIANSSIGCVFVTHYPELTKLAQEYPERVRNYTMQTETTESGLRSTYKLTDGIAQFDAVFDIIKNEFHFR